MTKLKGVRYASILDANHAFWHLLLDEESSLLMTFATAGMGCFCFTKLPFGLNCSGDYFQLKLDALYHDEPNQTGIVDDIVIVGYKDDGSNYDAAVERCLRIAQTNGLQFNPAKCIFRCTQLPFFGQLNNHNGQLPDPEKVHAIQEFATQTSKEALHTFIGMANYLSKFIPHLAELLKPIQLLTSPKVDWIWMPHHQDTFDKVKQAITDDCLLSYYDPN